MKRKKWTKPLEGLALTWMVLIGFIPGIGLAGKLPRDHVYQVVLRDYLAQQTVADFAVERLQWDVDDFLRDESADERYRLWLLSRFTPSVDHLAVPPEQFLLDAIESPDGIRLPYTITPRSHADNSAWLPGWDHPGNPYRHSVPLMKRALVVAVIDMLMLDARHENSPSVEWSLYGLERGRREGREKRSNSLSGSLIWMAHTYCVTRDLLPEPVREAYAYGLGKFVRRIDEWGPTGMNTNMDLFAAVSLGYVIRCIDDPHLHEIAKAYIRRLYTDPQYFDPAGYTVEIQGYDASYSGISLFKQTWGALMRDWSFERDALAKAYRLKAHLSLPEPDGLNRFGPSHFSTRTSADSVHDQFNFPQRDTGAAMIVDDALYLVRAPDGPEMEKGITTMIERLNAGVERAKPIPSALWNQRHWSRPVNYAHDFYVPGSHDRLRQLAKADSPLLKLPVERADRFIRRFGDAFVVARFPDYYAILHTGPVGESKPDWPAYMPTRGEAYWGFSGGALSAFWTPDGGAVLLGRRGGYLSNNPDLYENWRSWPTHAVSGVTREGRVFSSARTLRPDVTFTMDADRHASVVVAGDVPRAYAGYGESLAGTVTYRRSMAMEESGVRIETSVEADGRDGIGELYETLPVFFHDARRQPDVEPPSIEVLVDGAWQPAGSHPVDGVTSITIRRFSGGVVITFDRSRRVALAPDVWTDDFQSRAVCRTLLIDLLEDTVYDFRSGSVEYIIRPSN